MTLDRFKVFAAAARYHSVTRASEEIYITQPAVTKQLKALEGDYNANLYRRNGRGIELTEAGQTFLKKII
jgi:DNA-binding transcriptional LysR family regulator